MHKEGADGGLELLHKFVSFTLSKSPQICHFRRKKEERVMDLTKSYFFAVLYSYIVKWWPQHQWIGFAFIVCFCVIHVCSPWWGSCCEPFKVDGCAFGCFAVGRSWLIQPPLLHQPLFIQTETKVVMMIKDVVVHYSLVNAWHLANELLISLFLPTDGNIFIWPSVCMRQIWPSGVSLKRTMKM